MGFALSLNIADITTSYSICSPEQGLEISKKFTHPLYRDGPHFNARAALFHLMLQYQISLKQHPLKENIISNHLELKNDPDWKVSLSHTKNYGLAMLARGVRSVGIDCEFFDRKINEKALRHYAHPKDDDLSLITYSYLGLWCIKEASFKALSPLTKEPLYLKDIWVKKEGSFGIESKQYGQYDLKVDGPLLIARAFI